MSYNRLSFGVVHTALVDTKGMISDIWARWVGTSLVPAINNTTPLSIPGPYPSDAAAEAGGVPVQGAYYKSDGTMWTRLT